MVQKLSSLVNTLLPDQTGNTGKVLTSNGTTTSWSTVDSLPVQTGNSGKILSTNGTSASWITPPSGGAAVGGTGSAAFFENDITITASYTITSGKNAGSFGPITVADGVVITVPNGSTWTVV